MLTEKQIKWASQHDWFIESGADGTILVKDSYVLDSVLYEPILKWTGTFAELRAWAGY